MWSNVQEPENLLVDLCSVIVISPNDDAVDKSDEMI
jgi:hypothetical protein